MCFFSVASAQVTLPIDFESGTTTSDFTDFDGGFAEVVANPAPDAVNDSETVCRIVRDGGLPWGGSLLEMGQFFDFSEETSIRMKVWSPRQGVRIKMKLEGYLDTEIDQWNVTQGGWEVMTWNFAGEYSMTYDKLVFMFDFENVGDGSDQSTFYFDDIEQVDASGGLSQIDLPCTFEDETVDQTTYDFWGNASQIVEDPTAPGQPRGGGHQDAGSGGMVRHHDRHHRRLCQPHSFHRGGEDDQRSRVDAICWNAHFAQDGDYRRRHLLRDHPVHHAGRVGDA